jgi:hypothetical protein
VCKGLVYVGNIVSEAPDEGSITDGDDHVWLGNPDTLADGQWWEFNIDGMLGKRPRSMMSESSLLLSAKNDLEEVHRLLDAEDDSDLEEEVCQ